MSAPPAHAGTYHAHMCGRDLRWNTHRHHAGILDSYTVSGADVTGAADVDDHRLSCAAISDNNSGRFNPKDGRKHSHTIASVLAYERANRNVRSYENRKNRPVRGGRKGNEVIFYC